jgi:hypothetical protein
MGNLISTNMSVSGIVHSGFHAGDIFEDDCREVAMAQHLFGVKNLNAHQRLAFTDVQTDFVRQAQCAALVFTL